MGERGSQVLMNTKTKGYLLTVTLMAVLVLPFLRWQEVAVLHGTELTGALALLGICVISEILVVWHTVGQQRPSSSIAFLPYFAATLLFGPTVAVATGIATVVGSQFILRRRSLLRIGFNASQVSLALLAGSAVFRLVGGRFGMQPELTLLTVRGFAAFMGMASVFFLVNHLLVSIALALNAGDRVRVIFRKVIGGAGGSIGYDLIVSPIGAVLALQYSYFAVGGLLMIVLPLLIIRHSYAAISNLERANKDLLSVLVKTIETRDPYTSGHSIRVSILARAIAEDMGLSMAVVDRIEMAGLVHDIGKVDAVYATIIRKEGALTEAERKVIVTHAEKGAEFLETLTSFRPDVIRGVRHHHERFDGTGYPDGLQGDQIPLAARIIMLCDSIDAMLSDRPYRKALPVEHVRSELVRCAGTQFDPKIVDVIIRKNTLERAAALVRPESAKPHLVIASA
jgi:putative nucleotidyltransferase with HDIG domain